MGMGGIPCFKAQKEEQAHAHSSQEPLYYTVFFLSSSVGFWFLSKVTVRVIVNAPFLRL